MGFFILSVKFFHVIFICKLIFNPFGKSTDFITPHYKRGAKIPFIILLFLLKDFFLLFYAFYRFFGHFLM